MKEVVRTYSLAEIAEQIGATLLGEAECPVEDIAPLNRATANQLSFLSSPKFQSELAGTDAAAVILRPEQQDLFAGNRLLMDDPYLGYAKAATLFHPFKLQEFGVHPTATVHLSAIIDAGSWIGPRCMVMAGVRISSGVHLGPGCLIAEDVVIGSRSRLIANVTVMDKTVIGEACIIHPGAVLGSDGFGFAQQEGRWIKIPQLGRVVLGDDVEIGANSTIDRGAFEDTVIERGVKLDNLVHLAHNVHIGEDCAMAAMVAVAGSTTIGAGCTFGGQVGIVGHLDIAAGTHCTARTMVTHSIREPGLYSSATPADPNRKWRRNVAQFRNLNDSIKRLRALEKRVKQLEQSVTEEIEE
ncbi:MAG: UDP-3-O-(3-hydroxymyristoyl)glucosamine N-acyltransferase [Gammaproteobacteria bacterium]|nr:UDP-3-O-(3-hydroxymyristoyl)glucosamine N-acyltransferase [Gammaproteobacteria bacterium]